MRTILLSLVPALLAPLAVAQTPAKIHDIVIKKDGSRVRGVEITEFLLTGVRGKRGNDPFEVPAHQVVGVEWSNAPEQFLTGRAAMDRGDYRAAAQLFGDVQSDRPLVKADAEFFKIKAAVNAIGNDKAAAATAAGHAKQWLTANANHWRTPEAMLLAGRAERLAATGGAAAATLRELEERSLREQWGAIWGTRAKAELALTLLADGKGSEARTTFKDAANAAEQGLATAGPDTAELKALRTMARVGEGETYLADKDYAKAEAFFRGLITSNEPELVAAGHAGSGEATFLVAVAANKLDDVRKAQLAFAQASVSDVQSGEASAKANYYLGRCLMALGQEREGDDFKQRANAYYQIVVGNYPNSRWIGPAKAEMAK